MKLGEGVRKSVRKDRAVDMLKTQELTSTVSFRDVFNPVEWQEVEAKVFRSNKNFGYVSDRYYLSKVSEDPRHEVTQEEELYKIGREWVGQVLTNNDVERIDTLNIGQALHCLKILGRAFPEKRQDFPQVDSLKSFVQESEQSFFSIDPQQPKGVGLRILLSNITSYLTVLPEERTWVMRKLSEQKIEQKVQPTLELLAAENNWGEFLHLSAEARLLFPHLPISHKDEMVDYFKRQKPGHKTFLYTLLPDLLDLRIILAERAELDTAGLIYIQDPSKKLGHSQPLPERSAA